MCIFTPKNESTNYLMLDKAFNLSLSFLICKIRVLISLPDNAVVKIKEFMCFDT